MSLFDGAERRVETHKTGNNTRYNQFGKKIYNVPEKKEAVTEHVTATIIQGPEETKPELSEAERKYRESQLQKTINKNNYVNNLAQLGEVTKVGVLENILTSLVYESLYLDDEFKDFNMTVIEEAVHNFVEDRGGYSYLTDAYNRTKSPLLKSIMDICEESGKEINQRRITEMKDGKNNELAEIRFNVTSDEKDRIDYSKDSIGIQQVADAIKNKVLNVVKDEKKRETEHAELMDEIESQLTEDPEVNNPEQVAEALSKIFIKNTNIEEATLFNTILRTNYKRVLENGYEGLDLMRMNDNEINVNDDNFMNTKLDDFLLDEDVNMGNKLVNGEIQNIFDEFIYQMDNQNESDDMERLIESFSSIQVDFSNITNSAMTLKDLKEVRNDFIILQEVFTDMIDVIEPVGEGRLFGAIKDELIEIDDKTMEIIYGAIVKMYRNPYSLKKAIARDNKVAAKINDELQKRADDDKLSDKVLRLIAQLALMSTGIGVRILPYLRTVSPKWMLKQTSRYNRIFVQLAERRLKELEYKEKLLTENYDTVDEFDDGIDWIEEGKDCKGDCKGKGMSIVNDNDIDAVKDTIPKKDNKKDEKKDDKKEEHKKEETKKNGSAIETTFTPDSLRNKDIVKECINDIFAGYISTIDEKLEAHERANETAKQSVLENVNGERLLIPIVKKSDMQLDGLNLAYKMKHVLESLTNLCNHYEGAENIALIKHAVESNIKNTNYVLETYKSIPSTPAYKVCYFQTFKDLLNMIHENVNELAETYDDIDIKEIDYDDVDGDLLIDDDYNSFRILTESIDDNPIYGEAECIDMDFILANSIFEYTIMETMYTIQLESYDYDSIKSLTNDILNGDIIMEAKGKGKKKGLLKTLKEKDKELGDKLDSKIKKAGKKIDKASNNLKKNADEYLDNTKKSLNHLKDEATKKPVKAVKDTVNEFKKTGKNIKKEHQKSKKKK